jgi:hypothetical protein
MGNVYRYTLVHNNVQFMTLKFVDPATYQILGNLKIVTTAGAVTS